MSLTFPNGGILITEASELPRPNKSWSKMYMDLETTSGNPKKNSLNPWHDCFVAGIALTVDDCKDAWYIPVQHHHGVNLDIHVVHQWVQDVFECCDVWINHNVKYDAQVMSYSFGVTWDKEVVDTVTLAKLVNSDRMHFGLKALAKEWLHENDHYEDELKPYLVKNKDFGAIPSDICGEYACHDVLKNRRLYKFILANMPEESHDIARIENKTTEVLLDIERNGMKVNPSQLEVGEFLNLNAMTMIQDELANIVGYTFEPHVNADCHDVLCNKYGLPIVSWTDAGNPSFDKEALKSYLTYPGAPRDVINLMLQFRKKFVLTNTFIRPYRELNVDGLLHSSYNQTVRTGRMSCKMPNAQQLSSDAKEYIVCDDDEVMISCDYSQIEYRIIAHYIKDYGVIEAYKHDPFTDFHTWVAEMCEIHRKPAKTVNFLMGYGGGYERLLSNLIQIPELVGDILEQVEKLDIDDNEKKETFTMLARTRAGNVYRTYHDTMPGLKRTSRQAANLVLQRGYIRTLYGRRRHLPAEFAHRAFNSLCQGSAADLMKARLVELWLWLKEFAPDVKLIGVVHDEVLMRAPKEVVNDRLLQSICFILEDVQMNLRVPIRTSCGMSTGNWRKASSSAKNLDFPREAFKLSPV